MREHYTNKTGPTADPSWHYKRIVAKLESGEAEVFCSHTMSLAEAKKEKGEMNDAANCGDSVATSSRLLELFNAEF